jgi:uncharacterized LabA/DUF88 family protein
LVPKKVSYNNIDNVLKFINSFINKDSEEVYRIFVYLCEPYGGKVGGVDYKTTKVYEHSTSFIEKLQSRDLVAIRKGTLVLKGTDKDNKGIFAQKQVDMLLGLDIAHVSYNKLVDRILVLTCDTDLIPAMKIARTNRAQVIWGCCPDTQPYTPMALKKHSDFVRQIDFNAIF